jgi:hypothetical protein
MIAASMQYGMRAAGAGEAGLTELRFHRQER